VQEQLQKGESPYGGFEPYDVFFNDNKGNFALTEPFCEVVVELGDFLKSKGVEVGRSKIKKELIAKAEPELAFLLKLRQYLSANLAECLPSKENASVKNWELFAQLSQVLKLGDGLDKSTLKKLLWRL
jgi:hypothetical protein